MSILSVKKINQLSKKEIKNLDPYEQAAIGTLKVLKGIQKKYKTIPSNGTAPTTGDLTGKRIHQLLNDKNK